MSTVMVPADIMVQLLTAGEWIEFRDESGAVVRARKESDPSRDEQLKALVGAEHWPSDEELDRIIRDGRRYTVDEVMARLRGLTK